MNATALPRILVVDDSERNSRLLVDLLNARGHRASAAASGEEALARIDAEAPDLLLLDVMMPGLSGYEVCERLRADPRYTFLPIVLVTALDPAKERLRGLEAGADDFLTKPINPPELLARVRSLLRVKALHDELQRLRADAATAASVEAHGSELERDVFCLRVDIRGLNSLPELSSLDLLHQATRDFAARAAAHGGQIERLAEDGAVVRFDATRDGDAVQALSFVTAALSCRPA